MGRTKLDINMQDVESMLHQVELNGPLINQSAVWNAIADLYNKQYNTDISPAVFRQRILEANLNVQTKPGKKGRQPGVKVERTSRANKFQSKKGKGALKVLRGTTPANYLPIVDKIEAGSMKAAVKLHCLECCGFDDSINRVRNCEIKECSLWLFRPYQKTKE